MNKEIKGQARELRAQGKTYSEIKSALNINNPKSTISSWCQGVDLPLWYNEKINSLNHESFNKARKIAWVSNQKKREDLLKSIGDKAKKTLSFFNEKDIENLKIVLAILYLGEGAKWKGHSGLMLGSSDPNIILLYIELLRRCYNIKPNQMACRISFRADQDIKKLEKFWSQTTNIPPEKFYKTIPDPRTIGKKTLKTDYMGVCVVTCKGVDIQLELEQIAVCLLNRLKGPIA